MVFRFNGAAPMKARKLSVRDVVGFFIYSFNGAAPMKARKPFYHGLDKNKVHSLQWGRADEGAETRRR